MTRNVTGGPGLDHLPFKGTGVRFHVTRWEGTLLRHALFHMEPVGQIRDMSEKRKMTDRAVSLLSKYSEDWVRKVAGRV